MGSWYEWALRYKTRDELADAYRRILMEKGESWPGIESLDAAITRAYSEKELRLVKDLVWNEAHVK